MKEKNNKKKILYLVIQMSTIIMLLNKLVVIVNGVRQKYYIEKISDTNLSDSRLVLPQLQRYKTEVSETISKYFFHSFWSAYFP